jgi:hypothetical protein
MSTFKEKIEAIKKALEGGVEPEHLCAGTVVNDEDARCLLELIVRFRKAEEALNRIACWDEGETVNGTFDSPGNAQFARAALAEITKPLC